MSKKKPPKRSRSRDEHQNALRRVLPTLYAHGDRLRELVRRLLPAARENAISIGIAVILFLRPFVSGKTYEWSNGVCQIAIYALFVMWIARACRLKKLTFRAPLLAACLGVFVVVSGMTFFTSVNSDGTYRRFFELLSYLLIFVMAASAVRGPKAVAGIMIVVVAASVLVCGHGFYQGRFGLDEARTYVQQHRDWVNYRITGQQLTPEFMHRIGSNRIFSYFLHPNSLAGYLIILIPISICSFIATARTSRGRSGTTGKRERRSGKGDEELPPFSVVAWLIVAIVQIAALVWTFSRGAWLSLFVSLVCLAFFVLSRGRRWWREAAVAVCLCSFSMALSHAVGGQEAPAVQPPAQDGPGVSAADRGDLLRGQSPTVSDLVSQATWEARITYWQGALGMIKARPFLGVGSAAFGSAYPRFMVLGGYPSQEAHNDPLQVLAETGFIGFVPFMAFWLLVVLFGLRWCSAEGSISVRWLRIGLLFGIVSFLLHSLVDFDFQIPGIALTVCAFCGLLVAASDVPDKMVRFGWGRGILMLAGLAAATALSLRPHVADALFYATGFALPAMFRAWWRLFVSARLLCFSLVAALICGTATRLVRGRAKRAGGAYRAGVTIAWSVGLVAFLALPRALDNMSLLKTATVDQRGFGIPYRANQLEAAHTILRGETAVPDLLLVTLFPNKNERERVRDWRTSGADPAALTRRRLKEIETELSTAAYIYPYEALYHVYIGKVDSWLAPFERERVRGWDSAISRFQSAVELNPWNHYWRVLLGQALFERSALGDRRYYVRKALGEFEKAAENYPTNPEVWRHLGTAFVYAGERTRAQSCFQRARELEEHAQRRRGRVVE